MEKICEQCSRKTYSEIQSPDARNRSRCRSWNAGDRSRRGYKSRGSVDRDRYRSWDAGNKSKNWDAGDRSRYRYRSWGAGDRIKKMRWGVGSRRRYGSLQGPSVPNESPVRPDFFFHSIIFC